MGDNTEKVTAEKAQATALQNLIGSKGLTGLSLAGLLLLQLFSMLKDSSEELKTGQRDMNVKIEAMDNRLGALSTAVSTQGAEFNSMRESFRDQMRDVKDELKRLREKEK